MPLSRSRGIEEFVLNSYFTVKINEHKKQIKYSVLVSTIAFH